MNYSTLKNSLTALLVLACLFPGCGGGSRGTGTLSIEGRILTRRGAIIAGADVTNIETGATAKTDTNGSFALMTERLSGELSFLVETDSLQVTSKGGATITSDAEVVAVDIVIDTDKSTPTAAQSVTIKKKQSSGSSSSTSSKSSKSSSSSSQNSSSSKSSSGNSSSSSSSSSDSSDDDSSSSSSSSSSDDSDSEVRVSGLIQSLTATTITVRDTTFTVNSQTDYDHRQNLSQFSVGEDVEVRGHFIQGTLIAEKIKFID